MLGSWLHLISLVVYLGTVVGLCVILLPALPTIQNHERQVEMLARSLKLYNPLQTGALGFLVLSGAFQVTELKATYRELFIKEFGATLMLKLILSFVLIVLSVYQSMAVAHRFVKRYEQRESLSSTELQSVARTLRASALAILVLGAVTVWLGIGLRR